MDRQLGRQVPTLIDDQHRMGAGIDGGTDLDEVRRHGVGAHQGMTSPAFRGRRAEDIGPFGARRGAPAGACHVWPIGV